MDTKAESELMKQACDELELLIEAQKGDSIRAGELMKVLREMKSIMSFRRKKAKKLPRAFSVTSAYLIWTWK